MCSLDSLLEAVDRYAGATGTPVTVVSFRLFGDSRIVGRLRLRPDGSRQSDLTTGRYMAGLNELSKMWPEGLAWPQSIARPSAE